MNKVNPCKMYVKIDGGKLRIITGFRTELDCITIWFRNEESEVFSLDRVEIFENSNYNSSKWEVKENNSEIPCNEIDNKQCILCGRINYGGAKFEVVVGRIKSDYICTQCIEKGRKDEAVLKCSV